MASKTATVRAAAVKLATALEEAAAAALPGIADELGALEKEHAILIAPFKQKLERIKVLEKQLRDRCPTKPGEEWRVMGAKFEVVLGPRAKERKINFTKLVRTVGAAAFLKFATCTLTALEENVKPEVVASVVTAGQTGTRSIKTFEKGAA